MMKKTAYLILIVFFFFGCDLQMDVEDIGTNLTEEQKNNIKKLWLNTGAAVNDHCFNWEAEKAHAEEMINKGVLKNVRIGHLDLPYVREHANWYIERGVTVLGIYENKALKQFVDDPSFDINEDFSKVVRANPGVKYWNIGNECNVFIEWRDNEGKLIRKMEEDEYMKIFKKVFFYACENHPDLILLNAPTLGITGGAGRLGIQIENGLFALSHGYVSQEDITNYNLKLADNGPGFYEAYRFKIVCFNFYSYKSDATDEYSYQLKRLSPKIRRWVTETGVEDWKKINDFVLEIYPRMINEMGVEKIFFYVFSQHGFHDPDDPDNRLDLSLVNNLALPLPADPAFKGGAPEWSPLGKALGLETPAGYHQDTTLSLNSSSDSMDLFFGFDNEKYLFTQNDSCEIINLDGRILRKKISCEIIDLGDRILRKQIFEPDGTISGIVSYYEREENGSIFGYVVKKTKEIVSVQEFSVDEISGLSKERIIEMKNY
jgi:hypothetical protein